MLVELSDKEIQVIANNRAMTRLFGGKRLIPTIIVVIAWLGLYISAMFFSILAMKVIAVLILIVIGYKVYSSTEKAKKEYLEELARESKIRGVI